METKSPVEFQLLHLLDVSLMLESYAGYIRHTVQVQFLRNTVDIDMGVTIRTSTLS